MFRHHSTFTTFHFFDHNLQPPYLSFLFPQFQLYNTQTVHIMENNKMTETEKVALSNRVWVSAINDIDNSHTKSY